VYGPRQAPGHAYAAVVPTFVAAALAGEPLPIHGDGNQSRDFTSVRTVVDVIADAIERGVSYDGPVNLAFGSRSSLLDVVARLEHLLGSDLAREHAPSRPGDVPHSQADGTLMRSLFPDVQVTSLDDGLRETVAWMANRTDRRT
jgi:UDP-glucose 4-epimerase